MARQQAGQSGQQQNEQNGQQGGQQNQSGQPQAAQSGQQTGGGQPNRPGQQGQTAQQQGQSGQPGQQGQSGQHESPSARSSAQGGGREMRDISEEMRNAASDLGRQQTDQASARAARALEKLRDLERSLEAGTPDGRRRALGDLQLEARQLADAQRQIASESRRAGQNSNDAAKDALRRLAGEQDRLADRLSRVQEGLKQQGNSPATAAGKDGTDARGLQQAAGNAAREMERQRLGQRMQQSADSMRASAGRPDAARSGSNPAAPSSDGTPAGQEEIARALDRLADSLASAARPGDDQSNKLSANLSRTQELRERLDNLSRQLDQVNQEANNSQSSPTGRSAGRQGSQNAQASERAPGDSDKPGQGQGGAGGSSADVGQIREQLNREVQEVRELLDQLRREDPTYAQGGRGLTFEGQGMTLSAPGTEGFKQDFAKWQDLKRQIGAALEQVESTLTKKLQERNSKDRLSAGADDQAPAAYQQQVDSYFKALATRKKQQ
jgi:hypothetical protein